MHTTVIDIEKAGSEAVRRLRADKLRQGHPFMINSRELPARQCYLEFPDGHFMLGQLSGNGRKIDLIRALTLTEIELLRRQYNLP